MTSVENADPYANVQKNDGDIQKFTKITFLPCTVTA